MLILSENNLFSFGLLLMLYQLMVSAAVLKPSNNSVISHQKQEVIPVAAANVQNQVFYPQMHRQPGPYYGPPPVDPNGRLNFNGEPIPRSSRPRMSSDERYPGDVRMPVEDPDYSPDYTDVPSSGDYYRHHPPNPPPPPPPHRGPTKKPKKIYKAIERVIYYPDSDSGEIARNKDALAQMKDFIPDEPNYDDHQDDNEQGDEVEKRKDYGQMYNNPPRGEQEDPEEHEIYETDGSGAQSSIADDVKQFGKESTDEANRFDKFLNNLRHFAENSEKEYSSPSETQNRDDLSLQDSDDSNAGFPQKEEIDDNPRYTDSLAAHTADDRTRDYERVSNYGIPEEYESEKNFYQNQRQEMDENKGGHRYHKDRRRPKKSSGVSDQEYDRRNREVSGLIDSEPEEGDYLSNYDVVKQMKNSEKKYNTGIDPIYSSKRDFDEVTRLEKMIENVALLNKQKERSASNTHDRHEGRDGSESKTEITKIPKQGTQQNQES